MCYTLIITLFRAHLCLCEEGRRLLNTRCSTLSLACSDFDWTQKCSDIHSPDPFPRERACACMHLESGDKVYPTWYKIEGPGYFEKQRSTLSHLRRGPGPILMITCIVWEQDHSVIYLCACTGDWIRERFEKPGVMKLTEEEKKVLLARLVRSTKWGMWGCEGWDVWGCECGFVMCARISILYIFVYVHIYMCMCILCILSQVWGVSEGEVAVREEIRAGRMWGLRLH